MTMAGWRLSDDVVSLDDVRGLVRRMKTVNFDSGKEWSYSNTNYTLAGLIVERKNKAKQTLAQFAHDNIFQWLAMTSTRFVERHGEIVANRAYGYRGKKDFDKPPFEVRMPNYDLTGPTNLVTTVEDLIRWEANFYSKIVGDDAIFAKMHMPHPINKELGYGFGLYIGKDAIGGLIVEHDGRDAGYRSHLFRYPDKQLAVALLCNVWMPDRTTHRLVRAVAATFLGQQPTVSAAPSPPPQVSSASGLPADYVGRYYSDEIDTVYDVKLDGGKLWIVRNRYAPSFLMPRAGDTFRVEDFSAVLPASSVRFKRDSQGKVDGLVMDDRVPGGFGRLWDFHFRRLP